MYQKLDCLTLNQLISFHTLLNVFKIRESGEPEDLARLLNKESRNSRIMMPRTFLSLASKSFVWRGARDWNLLPVDLRMTKQLGCFKRRLKVWVKENVADFTD